MHSYSLTKAVTAEAAQARLPQQALAIIYVLMTLKSGSLHDLFLTQQVHPRKM